MCYRASISHSFDLVDWKGLKTVRIDSWPDPKLLTLSNMQKILIVPYIELSPDSRWTFAGPMQGGTQCHSHNTEEGSDIKSSYMPSCSWPDNHPSTSYQECRRFHWCRCRHNQGWCNCFSPYVRMSSLCRMVRKTLLLKRSDLRITCRLGSCCHQASC